MNNSPITIYDHFTEFLWESKGFIEIPELFHKESYNMIIEGKRGGGVYRSQLGVSKWYTGLPGLTVWYPGWATKVFFPLIID